jgi:hypothetical protein
MNVHVLYCTAEQKWEETRRDETRREETRREGRAMRWQIESLNGVAGANQEVAKTRNTLTSNEGGFNEADELQVGSHYSTAPLRT